MNLKNSDRDRRMVLAKKREVSIGSTGAESPIPSAGGWQGDLIGQANAGTEANLQILVHQTDVRFFWAIKDALARINESHLWSMCRLRTANPEGASRRGAVDTSL